MKKLETNFIRDMPRQLLYLVGFKPFFNCNKSFDNFQFYFLFVKLKTFH